MIRRLTASQWLLIAQDDHARVAGELAARIGNALFDRPDDFIRFRQAVSMHDAGWIDADQNPCRNAAGEPIDFTEWPLASVMRMWASSSEKAAALDPLCGLLVSLHSLSLSINASADTAAKISAKSGPEVPDAATRFALNKFQHRQIELQEQCRRKLGLANDQPLRHGLAIDSDDPHEKSIAYQFRLLQAMDALSLAACCTKPPATSIKPMMTRPGGRSITLRLRRVGENSIHVSPWPFEADRIALDVPAARLPATALKSDEMLQSQMAAAPSDPLTVMFTASR